MAAVGNTTVPPRTVHLLHSSEYPKSSFIVLDTFVNSMVADSSLDAIFSNLKAFFAPRKGLRIEVKGQYHEVQQYTVKFGSLLFGATSKGVIVEVRVKGVCLCVCVCVCMCVSKGRGGNKDW